MEVPTSVRFVRPLLARAQELDKSRPILAYFCRMQAVERVLATQLHKTDPDAAEFAGKLMTKLEESRESPQLQSDDAKKTLEDPKSGREYVEAFAESVLDRAQREIDQGKVSQNTGATLVAAGIFFELESIWGDIPDEPAAKIKFCKYQATRILKAVKEGQDPNELFESHEDTLALERELEGDKPSEPSKELDDSDKTPSDKDLDKDLELPGVPDETPNDLPRVPGEIPGVDLPRTPSKEPNSLGLPLAPEAQPSVPFDYESAPKIPQVDEFRAQNDATPEPGQRGPRHQPKTRKSHSEPVDVSSVIAEAELTSSAQRHAKFAISALNYEDFETAERELEAALQILRTRPT